MKIVDAALYFCDNGMILCGAHLGASARTTGRDISGQRIKRVTTAEDAEFVRQAGQRCSCETCGKMLAREVG